MSKKSKKQRQSAVRESARVKNATFTTSEGNQGSELYEFMTGGIATAGVALNERTAMSVGAVYACVSLIGGSVASLPLPIYPRQGDRVRQEGLPISRILNEEYRTDWPAAVAREHHIGSVLLNGDGYALIHRVGGGLQEGEITGIEPLSPREVDVFRHGDRLKYRFTLEGDKVRRTVDQDDMLHFPGLGYDGVHGMTPLKHWLRMAAGIALAADEYSAAFFQNGARPDFALRTDGTIEQSDIDTLRKTWSDRFGGPTKAHLPAVLSGGLDVRALNINADDAELIATRRLQVEEIARIFGVPPHMIGHTEKASAWGTGIEQLSIGFVKYTLQRHLTKIEQEFNRKIFRGKDLGRYFCEFTTAGLERGDTKGRFDAYRSAIGRAGEPGWMVVNEVRRLENLPPVDGGDELTRADQQGDTGETANAQ